MTTKTRTPDEIYDEIQATTFQKLPAVRSAAEGLAIAEADLVAYRRREQLWRELERSVPMGAPMWTWAAASAAVTAAAEKVFHAEDRVERYRKLVAEQEEPQDGHRYGCCGKVGRISRHETWCSTMKEV